MAIGDVQTWDGTARVYADPATVIAADGKVVRQPVDGVPAWILASAAIAGSFDVLMWGPDNAPVWGPLGAPAPSLVWIFNRNDALPYTVSQFYPDGSFGPVPFPPPVDYAARGAAKVGSQVWFADDSSYGSATSAIRRLAPDHSTAAAAIVLDSGFSANYFCVVNDQVWVPAYSASTGYTRVYRFTFAGTLIGYLTGNGMAEDGGDSFPYGVVDCVYTGSNVWVLNVNTSSAPCISRFQANGTPIDSFIPTGIAGFLAACRVGSQVWILGADSRIYFLDTTGAVLGSMDGYSATWYAECMRVVGSQVWVTSGDGTIQRYNVDGSSAGADLSGNGMVDPHGIVVT